MCVPELDPECGAEPPSSDEIVGGVNLTALFATPTAAEIEALNAAPGPTATTSSSTLVSVEPDASGARRYVLALDQANQRIATALVRVPGTAADVSPLPVIIVLTDGTDGASEADLLSVGFGALQTRAVQVVLAYRGEALSLDGTQEFNSSLRPDPYRSDVSDVLALLGALPTVPRADLQRVALVGVGRGGTVALLASSAVDAVVTLGAPTDLFAPSFRAEVRTRLQNQRPPNPYPALDALAAPVFALRDGEIGQSAARAGLLAFSPARLRPDFPAVLALHAVGDRVVGDDQLSSLRLALDSAPGTSQIAELVENATHDDLPTLSVVRSQIEAFLLEVLS